jgi:hypothetical protein
MSGALFSQESLPYLSVGETFVVFLCAIADSTFGRVYDFLLSHVSVAFCLSSGIIFYEGYRGFSANKKYWIQWQLLGGYVAAVWLGTSVYYRWWFSVSAATLVLAAEALLTFRLWSKRTLGSRSTPG